MTRRNDTGFRNQKTSTILYRASKERGDFDDARPLGLAALGSLVFPTELNGVLPPTLSLQKSRDFVWRCVFRPRDALVRAARCVCEQRGNICKNNQHSQRQEENPGVARVRPRYAAPAVRTHMATSVFR